MGRSGLILISIILISTNLFARETVVKRLSNDVIVISPAKKQLASLGWPNDIINSIAVYTKEGIILIDTQNSPANALLIKNKITNVFNDTTFAYIVNTHGHSCHSGGNCIFNDEKIVAHTNGAAEIQNYDDIFLGQTVEFLRKKINFTSNILDTVSTQGALVDSINESIDLYRFYEDDLVNNYKARYADLTFDDNLILSAGNKTIELTYMGKGHGEADVAVYVKEEKLLCTGNLFHLGSYENEAMPSFYLNRPNQIDHWIKSLNLILENDINNVVSTHGKKFFDKKNIEFIRDYCVAVQTEVKAAKSMGKDLEYVQNIDLFKPIFNKYRGTVTSNAEATEMHKRNMAIIWKYLN